MPVCLVHETASPACRRTADILRNPDSEPVLDVHRKPHICYPGHPGSAGTPAPRPTVITRERSLPSRRSSRARGGGCRIGAGGRPQAMCMGDTSQRPFADPDGVTAAQRQINPPGRGQRPGRSARSRPVAISARRNATRFTTRSPELRRRSPGVYRRSAAGVKKRTMSSRAVGDRISFCIWALFRSIGPIRARICVS